MTKNETLSWRVGQLEKNYYELESKMDLILENHLPHIKAEISSLKTRIDVLTVVNVSAIILGLIVSKIF